ncbi:MAG TPA: pyrroline-5-carboxylate reductase dimerization domain-containing protein [Symbiobacteriaceae bacterium]|nr:pyrroline-5-carboxylate reductase dimerization domain-containing protein [Symbiobacteriaceae bacterium]
MNVGFIGMGNMGQMLVTALARAHALQPGELFASTRDPDKLRRLAGSVPGLQVAYSNRELAQRCQVIFLCLKPGETRAVLTEIAPHLTPDRLLVAITNTIDIAALEGTTRARVAKVIPSMVQSIQRGVSLLMFGDRCTTDDKAFLVRLMGAISQPVPIIESQARVASDLSSCGPAFVSYILRAFAHAARQYQPDLPVDTINLLIRVTAAATCELLERTGMTFDDVITRVSTPGGITADGIKVLDEQLAGVWEQVIETTIVKEEAKKARFEL